MVADSSSSKDTVANGEDGDTTKKIPYPKSIIFIISQEFCERFCYYGMRTVLSLYMVQHLLFPEDTATVIFHIFISFCYFTPVFGAIIADSFLGKFKTIFYLSIIYACGSIVLALASAEQVNIPSIPFSMIGLALIAIGTGGIKPCVAAFGGDQFILPQQDLQLASFFSIFYFSINAGSLISSTITPIFRKNIDCSSKHTCYPLAFAVPAVLMVVSLIVFLIGKPFYKIKPPEGNIVMKVIKCIGHAISQKRKSNLKRNHWMDFADDKYDQNLITDIKCLLSVLFLYIPIPVFWALYDQQGSTWTFQANRMDGYTLGYVIKPDQFQVINALLVLAFIPLFDKCVYPFLAKFNILKKPLQRLTTGLLLCAVSFVASGLLELKLQTTYPVLPHSGEINLNFINTLPCSMNVTLGKNLTEIIPTNQNFIYETIESKKYNSEIQIIPNDDFACRSFSESFNKTNLIKTFEINQPGGKAFTILIVLGKNNNVLELIQPSLDDDLLKAEGDSKIKIVYEGIDESWKNVKIVLNSPEDKSYIFTIMSNNSDKMSSIVQEVKPLEYTVTLRYTSATEAIDEVYDTLNLGKIEVASGGNYILSIAKNHTNLNGSVGHNQPFIFGIHTITRPNSIHILWLLPQYIIITVAEIMFSITGLQFSYSQAPESMKSVVQAAWLLTTAFGNLIVVGIAKAHFFDKQFKEIFLYAVIMLVDMCIFACMAYLYKPRNIQEKNNTEMNGDTNSLKKNQDDDGFNDEAL